MSPAGVEELRISLDEHISGIPASEGRQRDEDAGRTSGFSLSAVDQTE